MNYESMSDFEVNKAVSKRLGVSVDDDVYLAYQEANKPSVPASQSELTNKWVDYCNNPADAWPLMIQNKISIVNMRDYSNEYTAMQNLTIYNDTDCSIAASDKNPLRAAMIVFLMMSEK